MEAYQRRHLMDHALQLPKLSLVSTIILLLSKY